ncbi:putative SLACS reverse transcriptase [Trypanosoma cruzi]|uniref:Putative SLACS reverse transcriptase n=1 Tax=Trypanosoma cruzi TaxID=5693 RepID=A0A2V2WG10_TRYCR|nr:putative SLACS reverse transcriptase [Trypanosoma cruzi]
MRTTPSAARPSYPPSMGTPHEAHRGVSQDSSWARRGWWAFTKKDNWSTRGSRCGECAGAWCCDRSSSPSAPSPHSANWKAAFPTPASRRTWTTPRWRHHRACLGRCARRPPGRCVPWASRQTRTRRRSSIERARGHARGIHSAVCPRARCRSGRRPRERADYAVCATQGGGNRPPVPSNCGASVCEAHAVAAPVGAATRDVSPTEACPSTHESSGGVVRRPRRRRTGRHHGRTRYEARTRHCGPPSAPRRLRSPASEGDCGVCVRVSWREGKQRVLTEELDAKHQSDPHETMQTSDRKVFVSNTAAGAGRLLTDPQVRADDRVSPPTYGNDYWCVCCRRDRSAYVGQTHPMSTCIRAHDSNKTRGPHATK